VIVLLSDLHHVFVSTECSRVGKGLPSRLRDRKSQDYLDHAALDASQFEEVDSGSQVTVAQEVVPCEALAPSPWLAMGRSSL
jgi:hypothetical protein